MARETGLILSGFWSRILSNPAPCACVSRMAGTERLYYKGIEREFEGKNVVAGNRETE